MKTEDKNRVGNYRYYLCPTGVIKEEELPENWGLLVWDGRRTNTYGWKSIPHPQTNSSRMFPANGRE